MKRIFLAVVLFIGLLLDVCGQSGKWGIKFDAALHNPESYKSGDRSFLDINYDFGSGYVLIYTATDEVINIGGNEWGYVSLPISQYSLTARIVGIKLSSKLERDHHSDPGSDSPAEVEFESHSSNGLVGYKHAYYCDGECNEGFVSQRLYRGWSGYINLYVFPSDVQIAYKTLGDMFLPSRNTVRIEAPEGYTPETYRWVYLSPSDGTWRPFNNTDLLGEKTIDISAEDVYGANYIDSIRNFKNTVVALEFLVYDDVKGTDSKGYSNELTLQNILSAPQIDSVTYQMPTCHGNDDAKLFVHFNRELYENETLYVSTKGDRFTTPAVFSPGSKVLYIRNLLAYTFNISLHGTYKFGNNLSDTTNTYTDGEKHKYSIRIPDRPALNIENISQSPVHCYGGRDGKIVLKASGGVGVFDAFLEQGGTRVDSIRFASVEQGSFRDLKAGRYTIRLRDMNGCKWDSLGNEVVSQIEVAQPSQKVTILAHTYQEPTG